MQDDPSLLNNPETRQYNLPQGLEAQLGIQRTFPKIVYCALQLRSQFSDGLALIL